MSNNEFATPIQIANTLDLNGDLKRQRLTRLICWRNETIDSVIAPRARRVPYPPNVEQLAFERVNCKVGEGVLGWSARCHFADGEL